MAILSGVVVNLALQAQKMTAQQTAYASHVQQTIFLLVVTTVARYAPLTMQLLLVRGRALRAKLA